MAVVVLKYGITGYISASSKLGIAAQNVTRMVWRWVKLEHHFQAVTPQPAPLSPALAVLARSTANPFLPGPFHTCSPHLSFLAHCTVHIDIALFLQAGIAA